MPKLLPAMWICCGTMLVCMAVGCASPNRPGPTAADANGVVVPPQPVRGPVVAALEAPRSPYDDKWSKCTRLIQQIESLRQSHRAADATTLATEVVKLSSEMYGDFSMPTAEALNYAAGRWHDAGVQDRAKRLLDAAQSISNAQQPSMNNPFGQVVDDAAKRGEPRAALAAAAEQVAEYRRRGTVGQMGYGDCLAQYTALRNQVGDSNDAAEAGIRMESLNTDLPVHQAWRLEAEHADNQAQADVRSGDFEAAAAGFKRALAIYVPRDQEALSRDPLHAECAYCFDHQGELLQRIGKTQEARAAYAKAEKIGPNTIWATRRPNSYARLMNDVASLLIETGDDVGAAQYLTQAEAWCRRGAGDRTPEFARTLEGRAMLAACAGRSAEVVDLCVRAVRIRCATESENDSEYIAGLLRVANCLFRAGDGPEALAICRRAVSLQQKLLDHFCILQPQDKQLILQASAANRAALDVYLSLALATGAPAAETYGPVPAWKGTVALRQRSIRALAQTAPQDPLQDTTRYSTNMATPDNRRVIDFGAVPGWARLRSDEEMVQTDWTSTAAPTVGNAFDIMRQSISALSGGIKVLASPNANSGQLMRLRNSGQIAHAQASFVAMQIKLTKAVEARSGPIRPPTLDEVFAAIPSGAVLIDFDHYVRSSLPADSHNPTVMKEHLVAFVLTHDHKVIRVELGPSADIAELAKTWSHAISRGPKEQQAATDLRKLVWEPLLPVIGDARLVLISPDFPLNELPWAALPGDHPGHFLIEDRATVVEPSTASLLDLRPPTTDDERVGPSLLSVGDVDYGVAPSQSTVAGTVWQSLPGTAGETESIDQTFRKRWPQGNLVDLHGADAMFGTVLRQAAACRYLHLATHGFYQPPVAPTAPTAAERAADEQAINQVRRQTMEDAEAARTDPSRRVKARRFPITREEVYYRMTEAASLLRSYPGLWSGLVMSRANEQQYSAVVTGADIETLDLLHTDLVVLSACESAVGVEELGEGPIGLPHSFQIAGARTVVASLWKVNDDATRQLMKLFYQNLWQKRMGTLEAFRQAQIELLRTGVALGVANRSMRDAIPTHRALVSGDKLPPEYWAAFQLYGDWR